MLFKLHRNLFKQSPMLFFVNAEVFLRVEEPRKNLP